MVAHAVVCQPTNSGGFLVVHTQYKTSALLVQWVRRFLTSPNTWVSLMTFWYFDRFGASPMEVFSSPFDFEPSLLPPFYCSLLKAWHAVSGFFSVPLNCLAIGDTSVASITCKSIYKSMLSPNIASPHCVRKFRPVFEDLYWPATWRQLTFLPLDRKIIDFENLSWGLIYCCSPVFLWL